MSDSPSPTLRARQLRQKMTHEEKLLWHKLRGRKFMGLKFLRQHPIIYDTLNGKPVYFIPDFYCAEKKLIIEIDGKIHEFQMKKDQQREEILKGMGLRILRIRNDEINNNFLRTLAHIKDFVFCSP